MVTDAAYEACLRLARQHYENFPVASRLLPKASRPHIAAIYAFARIADDFADEGHREPAARLALLDDWQARLHAAVSGAPVQDGSDAARIFVALGNTIRIFNLDVGLFDDLLSAFRQDVLVTRYETWDDLLDYCRRSANPIGRLVLRVSGYDERSLDARADAVCTALQLTNFWQDSRSTGRRVGSMFRGEFVRTGGADENDLGRKRMSPEWQAVLGRAAAATRDLFAAGPAGCRRRERAAEHGSFARRGSAACGFSIGLTRSTSTSSDAGRLSDGATPRRFAWRAMTWR